MTPWWLLPVVVLLLTVGWLVNNLAPRREPLDMTTIRFGPRELDALWSLVLEGRGSFEDADLPAAEWRTMERVVEKVRTAVSGGSTP